MTGAADGPADGPSTSPLKEPEPSVANLFVDFDIKKLRARFDKGLIRYEDYLKRRRHSRKQRYAVHSLAYHSILVQQRKAISSSFVLCACNFGVADLFLLHQWG